MAAPLCPAGHVVTEGDLQSGSVPARGGTISASVLSALLTCGWVNQASATANAPAAESELDVKQATRPLPPRVDGPYLNITPIGAIDFAGITDYRPDGPFLGGGLIVRAGQVVYPWLSLGLTFTGVFGAANDQRLRHFALLAEFDIYPAPSLPLSLRLAAGAGGGRATEPGRDDRPGLFGAAFQAGVRYEWFPGAQRRRPQTAGGFALGPEIGWMGFTPPSRGESMVHGIYVGLSLGPYFGE